MALKTKAPKKRVEGKCCPKCGRTLPFAKFYPNKGWSEQVYRDLWCKDCVARECKSYESLKLYCYENNREWNDNTYNIAQRKAEQKLATNTQYNDRITSEGKKEEMLGRATAQAFFSIMNLTNFYKYVDNCVTYPSTNPNSADIPSEAEERKRMEYSKKWHGYFTPEQIEILEETLDQYERDFDLSDVSLQDYAMKVTKASFHADQVYDLMRRGEATISEYKDAQRIFDDLSKSSNFAACKRKPGEQQGMGSLGEIILRIESTGKLNFEGDIWPQDSVDAAIAEYRHALVAAGHEGVV